MNVPGEHLIPSKFKPEMRAYYLHGEIPASHHLQYLLENNFVGLVGSLEDPEDESYFWHWATWLYQYADLRSWGSAYALQYWSKMGGLEGIVKGSETKDP